MARYIDADRLARQAYEVAYPIVYDNNSHERGLSLMGIAQLLDEQPTADVVPKEKYDRIMACAIELSKALNEYERKYE